MRVSFNVNDPNIKYTAEVNFEKFLVTKIINSNSKKTKEINGNKRKLSMHCSSKIPKRYKTNAIVNDRNRAAGIGSVLTDEISKIRKKF